MFIAQFIRGLIIKRRLRVYKREKYLSYQKFHRKKVKTEFFDQVSHFWDNFLFCGWCKLWLSKFLNQFTTGKKFLKFKKQVTTDGTLENYIFKSALGVTGGMILVYCLFSFLVFEMNFPYSRTLVLCCIFGSFLAVGLAVSVNVRCVVLMFLPLLFSQRGRQALFAYALLLTMTGPTRNVLYNTKVLTESLVCTAEELKAATKNIQELIKAPFYAIKAAILAIVKAFKVIIEKVKDIFLAMKRIIISLISVIKSAADWLFGGTSMCNKNFGSPFQRCINAISEAVSDCKVSVPPWADDMCSVAYAAELICYPVKVVDYFCDFVSFISDDVFEGLKKKINDFSRLLKTMFYVKITFSHSFSFRTNQTKTMRTVASDIVKEVKKRTQWFTHLFSWMSFTFMFLLFYLIYQVLYYRYRYLSSLSFDNKYITAYFYDIDFKRTRKDLETVIPLTRAERTKYLEICSIRLLKNERRSLLKASWLLLVTMYRLGVHMFLDIALNWILLLIQRYGRLKVDMDVPNSIRMHAEGDGMLANLYRSVAEALKPLGLEMHMDTLPCLPNPSPPDYYRYKQIWALMGLIAILTLFQPYAKRMRNMVMSYYHPDTAKERAVWLYNHILRCRGNFLTFARRRLRRMFGLREKMPREEISILQRCFAMFPFLDWLFGQERGKVCLLCGEPESAHEQLIRCPTVDCIGLYCQRCYLDLKNTCPICLRPIDYGDLSDISEEKDSSDDNHPTSFHKQVNTNETPPDTDEEGSRASGTNAASSSHYSYSYQEKDFATSSNAPLIVRRAFQDVEAQKLVKYVTKSDDSTVDEALDDSSLSMPAKSNAFSDAGDEDFAVTVHQEEPAKRASSLLQANLVKSKTNKTDKSVVINHYFSKLEEYNGKRAPKNPTKNLINYRSDEDNQDSSKVVPTKKSRNSGGVKRVKIATKMRGGQEEEEILKFDCDSDGSASFLSSETSSEYSGANGKNMIKPSFEEETGESCSESNFEITSSEGSSTEQSSYKRGKRFLTKR